MRLDNNLKVVGKGKKSLAEISGPAESSEEKLMIDLK